MDSIKLTRKQARRFILRHQGLLPPQRLLGKEGIIEYVGRVGCIQFDPLDIVGRNPELVLQSRIDNYSPAMLEELLYVDRRLVDGWDKMMAIYRTEDWPNFYYRQREAALKSTRRQSDVVQEVMPEVRQSIQERGPLSSIDLEHDRKVDWPWGPTRLAKVALENLFYLGELVIHHKVHTRRVYDLASRHISEEILNSPDPHATQEQYHDWHISRRIGGTGLLWVNPALWRGVYEAGSAASLAAIKRLIKKGEVKELRVEDVGKPLFMRSIDMPELEAVIESNNDIVCAAIIAPLDNLMWARELINALFDFKYRWEVYKPVAERKYGYYVLPVLYGDRFVARFEPGRDKKRGALIIKNWWWEAGVGKSEEMCGALQDCFARFLKYLGTDRIDIDKTLVKREGLEWLPD
jgi:uncharacterized protein YcaQ